MQYIPESYTMTSMSYEDREFGTVSTPLGYIDETVCQLLATAEPNNRYAVRDVELNEAGQPVVIERNTPIPLSPHIQYREIKDRLPLQIIGAVDPPRICEERQAHLKIARWFNPDLHEEYRDQIFEPVPKFRGLLDACIATSELHFLVPRPVTAQERDAYHPENHEYLTGFALRDFYIEDDSSYIALNFVTPDFRKLFASRREELCEAVAAYDRDPQQYARLRNINLFNPSQEDKIHLYEILKIVTLSVVREQSLVEATHEYLAEESVQCSREMERNSRQSLKEEESWKETQDLLDSFVAQIVRS